MRPSQKYQPIKFYSTSVHHIHHYYINHAEQSSPNTGNRRAYVSHDYLVI